jgi:hypothetical protein
VTNYRRSDLAGHPDIISRSVTLWCAPSGQAGCRGSSLH